MRLSTNELRRNLIVRMRWYFFDKVVNEVMSSWLPPLLSTVVDNSSFRMHENWRTKKGSEIMCGTQRLKWGPLAFEKDKLPTELSHLVKLVCFDSLHPTQQFFRYVGMAIPALNQYLARINVFAQGYNTVAQVSTLPQSHCASLAKIVNGLLVMHVSFIFFFLQRTSDNIPFKNQSTPQSLNRPCYTDSIFVSVSIRFTD